MKRITTIKSSEISNSLRSFPTRLTISKIVDDESFGRTDLFNALHMLPDLASDNTLRYRLYADGH